MNRDERVLIIEPGHGAHHATYLRWLLAHPPLRPESVHLATFAESLRDDPRFRAIEELLVGSGRIITLPDEIPDRLRASSLSFRGLIERDARYYQALERLFLEARSVTPIDRVLLPYLDYATYTIALRGSPFGQTPWDSIAVRPSFHYPQCAVTSPTVRWRWIKEKLHWRLLRNRSLRTLFTIDPLFKEYVDRTVRDLAHRVVFVPEAAEISESPHPEHVRDRLGIPPGAFVLLVYGELRSYKGIDRLLDAASSPDFPERLHMLLAGPQRDEVRRLLHTDRARALREAGRITDVDQVIHGSCEGDIFAAADAAWIGYEGHFNMSAVMLQAGKAGLPVVACHEGLIGRLTQDHQLGLVVNVSVPSEVARACRSLASDPGLASSLGSNGRAFTSNRSTAEFASRIWGKATVDSGTGPPCPLNHCA